MLLVNADMERQDFRNDNGGKDVGLDISAKTTVLRITNNSKLMNIATQLKIRCNGNLVEPLNMAAEW